MSLVGGDVIGGNIGSPVQEAEQKGSGLLVERGDEGTSKKRRVQIGKLSLAMSQDAVGR